HLGSKHSRDGEVGLNLDVKVHGNGAGHKKDLGSANGQGLGLDASVRVTRGDGQPLKAALEVTGVGSQGSTVTLGVRAAPPDPDDSAVDVGTTVTVRRGAADSRVGVGPGKDGPV